MDPDLDLAIDLNTEVRHAPDTYPDLDMDPDLDPDIDLDTDTGTYLDTDLVSHSTTFKAKSRSSDGIHPPGMELTFRSLGACACQVRTCLVLTARLSAGVWVRACVRVCVRALCTRYRR
jgi:hypothetical protein